MVQQQVSGSEKNSHPDEVSPSAQRSIFRAEAFRHYVQNQEKVVLPPLVSPRAFSYIWLLAGIILIAGLLIAFWPWVEPWVVSIMVNTS